MKAQCDPAVVAALLPAQSFLSLFAVAGLLRRRRLASFVPLVLLLELSIDRSALVSCDMDALRKMQRMQNLSILICERTLTQNIYGNKLALIITLQFGVGRILFL